MRKRAAIFTFALGALASAAVLPKVFGFGNLAPATEVKAPFELIIPSGAKGVSFQSETTTMSRTPEHRIKLVLQGDVMVKLPGKVRLRVPKEPVVLVENRDSGETHVYLGIESQQERVHTP
jgi:hypothetical protein